ncbi:hypothetical protein DY000_02032779 [Brassica cretica]|uniref:Uncharacterized protein n=1 Tax=Brassica cretica TaxID=69181 RepID=A0ABQ7DQI9_BRACR|nr:hypothetical protein DY000_02032779 [Brassica cretica]
MHSPRQDPENKKEVTSTREWLRLKETCSTLLEVRVIPCWPFKTSEHMRCSCLSKGDTTWLVHEWAWDQMDQLGFSSEVGNAYGMSSLGNMANPLRKSNLGIA